MSNNRQIRVDALDFDQIKENLKDFLRGQDKFTDYDFDGSVLSVVLDVLAYNTHYNAMYTNMALNESFLDSASKYSSVVSLAKSLGYTASSVRSARARVNITLTNGTGDLTYTIPAGAVFRAVVDNQEYNFITDTDYTATLQNGVYSFSDVTLVEGTRVSRTITVTDTSEYVIPSKQADTTTLKVRVQESSGSSIYRNYVFAPNAIDVSAETLAYFIKQREDIHYQVYFGDGVVGAALSNGNVVHMAYNVSAGSAANYARVFTYSSGIEDLTDIDVVTVLPASGGKEAETIEEIKFNAPRAFTAQNRAVTASDYVAIISQKFPQVESVTVWGGQDNIPKVYGKVFIAAKPNGADVFSSVEKNAIQEELRRSSAVVSVIPEVVDPIYLSVELTSNVYYNTTVANRTVGELETAVRNSIANYGARLNKFGESFRYSPLVRQVDLSDSSITGNITTLRVRREVRVVLDSQAQYGVEFSNPIYKKTDGGTFYSTRFYLTGIDDRCYLKDDGNGIVELYSEDVAGVPTYLEDVGTIDYGTGSIVVPNLQIRGMYDLVLEYVITPASNDVIPFREYIVRMPSNLVTVNMIAETSGSFTFSSAR